MLLEGVKIDALLLIFRFHKSNGTLGDQRVRHGIHFLVHTLLGGSELFLRKIFQNLKGIASFRKLHGPVASKTKLGGTGSQSVDRQHGLPENLIQLFSRLLTDFIQRPDPVFFCIIGFHQLLVFLIHKQKQPFHRITADRIRHRVLNTALLDSHIDDIRSIGRKGQITVSLNHQENDDQQNDSCVFLYIFCKLKHVVLSLSCSAVSLPEVSSSIRRTFSFTFSKTPW